MHRRLRRLERVLLGLVAAALLAAPGTASAHIHSGVVGVSRRAAITAAPAGVSARVDRSDLALRLAATGGHTVVVPGRPIRLAGGGSATWHDRRVSRPGRWAIPVVVDGRAAALTGRTMSVPAPPAWPWLLLLAPLAAAAAWRRRGARETVALGALAGATTLLAAAAFAFDRYASTGTLIEAGDEAAFAALALGVLAFGPPTARAAAAGALGTLAMFTGGTKLSALTNGIVLSALPADVARLVVVLAIVLGAAALACAAGCLLHAEERMRPVEPARSDSFWSLGE